MITEDYVSFETAKLLKDKGFDEECYRFWQYDKANNKDDTDGISLSECNVYLPLCNSKIDCLFKDKLMSYGYSAPTLQMAMKWLRETHHIFIDIISRFSRNADNDVCFSYSCKTPADTYELIDGEWLCYEEAAEAAIRYCLENLIS